ncbi:hypothetical protein V2J09_004426 [Rumex salicifolius]
MGRPGNSRGKDTDDTYCRVYGIWAVLLLFAYASFDNLSAFSLNEIKVYPLPLRRVILSLVLVFLVVSLKVVERIVALTHASSATTGVRENLRKIINYSQEEDHQDQVLKDDPISMHGYKYLVGPRYSKMKDGEIVKGITLEKIWGCNGRLLSSESRGGDTNGQLKDTCLSFALFWGNMGLF